MTSDETLTQSLAQLATESSLKLDVVPTTEIPDLDPARQLRNCLILDATTVEPDLTQLLALIDRFSLYMPVIVIVAAGEIRLAVRCMLRGALDIIEQPWRVEDLRISIAAANCVTAPQASD